MVVVGQGCTTSLVSVGDAVVQSGGQRNVALEVARHLAWVPPAVHDLHAFAAAPTQLRIFAAALGLQAREHLSHWYRPFCLHA